MLRRRRPACTGRQPKRSSCPNKASLPRGDKTPYTRFWLCPTSEQNAGPGVSQNGDVMNPLVFHLATVDKRLLFYLDEDDEMMFDTVERLSTYTTSLLDGAITPTFLVEKWSDWFPLALAFVHAYGTEELVRLQDDAVLPQ